VPVEARLLNPIIAIRVLLLTNVVGWFWPFQRTVELLMKPAPIIVKVAPEVPAVTASGMTAVRTGAGLSGTMVNAATVDVPPPGAGLNTVTLAVPEDTRSLDCIVAFRVALFTNVVARLEPFQRTLELLMKPEPLTVRLGAG
jgi:hypothetical protein